MQIHCQEHLDGVLAYAQSIGDTTLQPLLERLKAWENNPSSPVVHLYYDSAPHSFYFEERSSVDGHLIMNGGILYHGVPGEADQSHAFCIDGRAYGWRMHT